MQKGFYEKLNFSIDENNSLLCVGLDPETESDRFKILSVIDQTYKYVCAYKLNLAFWLSDLDKLKYVIRYIPNYIPVILDGKFGDIPNTAKHYANFCFEDLGVDAVTVNPYMGWDSIEPFSEWGNKDKGIFVLTNTTNAGSSYLQNIVDSVDSNETIANMVAHSAYSKVLDCVVGRDYTKMREMAPDSIFLCPGVGAQGVDLSEPMSVLMNDGKGVIITASRSICKSSSPKKSAKELRDKINEFRRNTQV